MALDALTPQLSNAPAAVPVITPPPRRRRRRIPSEPLDLVAACNRVLDQTTDPRRRAALEQIAFHLLKSRQKAQAAK